MTDLSDWNGGSGAAAAQQGDVSWLRVVLEVAEKGVQASRFGALSLAASHADTYTAS